MTAIVYSTTGCVGEKIRYFDREIPLTNLVERPQGAHRAK